MPPQILAGCLLSLLSVALVRADTVYLKDGRVLELQACATQGAELRCRRAGGIVGIPAEQVDHVVAARPSAAAGRVVVARPAGGPMAVPPRDAPSPIAVELEASPPSRTELSAADAQRRIESLEASGRLSASSQSGDPERRREISVLHTYLGNLAMLERDYERGRESYDRALDYDPGCSVARLNRATASINLSRYDDAEGDLHLLLSEEPNNARALELAGEVAFRTGKLDEAVELWEKSLAIKEKEGLRARLEKARRLGSAERGFLKSTASHFELKFDGDAATQELAQQILDHLEASYSDLAARFSHFPQTVIQVTLYPEQVFREVTDSPAWVGGLYDGQIRIPIGGLTHLTPQARRVLTHELTHSFIATKTHGSAPQWIQEGMAQVAEGKSAAGRRAELARLCALLGEDDCGREFSYPKALSQVEFFLDSWSQPQLNDLLEAMGKGAGLDAAMRSAIGRSQAEFMSAWARSLTP